MLANNFSQAFKAVYIPGYSRFLYLAIKDQVSIANAADCKLFPMALSKRASSKTQNKLRGILATNAQNLEHACSYIVTILQVGWQKNYFKKKKEYFRIALAKISKCIFCS